MRLTNELFQELPTTLSTCAVHSCGSGVICVDSEPQVKLYVYIYIFNVNIHIEYACSHT